jgi:hypothetical protein
METNVKNNNSGVAAVNPVKADKVAKFVAGNPVNAVSKAEPAKEEVKKKRTRYQRPHRNSLNSRKRRHRKPKSRQSR